MKDLLAAVSGICAEANLQGHPAGPGLTQVAEAIPGLAAPQPLAPQRRPVVERHLSRALELAEAPAAQALAAAVAANAEALVWYDSYGTYGEDPELTPFLDDYAFSVVAGPDYRRYPIPYHSGEVMFGISLQGPGIFYPAHAHVAVEIYYLVGGRVDWQQGDGVWRPLSSGDFVLHESGEAHAMRTGPEPLLSFFAWVSDLDSQVDMVPPPQA